MSVASQMRPTVDQNQEDQILSSQPGPMVGSYALPVLAVAGALSLRSRAPGADLPDIVRMLDLYWLTYNERPTLNPS